MSKIHGRLDSRKRTHKYLYVANASKTEEAHVEI